MALSATPVQSATANSAGSSVTTLNVVLPGAPTLGNIVIVVGGIVGTLGASNAAITSTGISWTLIPWHAGSSVSGFLAVGRVHTGASATITVNAGTAGGIALAAAEFAGSNIRLDQNIAVAGSSTTPASGATGTTETADELWIGGLIARNAVTFSSPTNSFAITAQDKSALATTSDRSVALLAKVVSGTGTANAGATIGTSGIWIAIAATFEEVTAGSSSGMMVPTQVFGAEGFRIGA